MEQTTSKETNQSATRIGHVVIQMLRGLRVLRHLPLITTMAAQAMTMTTVLLRHAAIPPIKDDVADIVDEVILMTPNPTTPMTSMADPDTIQIVVDLAPLGWQARRLSRFPTMSSVLLILTKEQPINSARLYVVVQGSTARLLLSPTFLTRSKVGPRAGSARTPCRRK